MSSSSAPNATDYTFYVNEYAYETVEFTPKRPMQRKIVIRKDGNKKCLVVMCLFTLVLSISVGLIIAFPLEIIKLTVQIDLEAMLTEDVLGQCESFPVFLALPYLLGLLYWVMNLNGTVFDVEHGHAVFHEFCVRVIAYQLILAPQMHLVETINTTTMWMAQASPAGSRGLTSGPFLLLWMSRPSTCFKLLSL